MVDHCTMGVNSAANKIYKMAALGLMRPAPRRALRCRAQEAAPEAASENVHKEKG